MGTQEAAEVIADRAQANAASRRHKAEAAQRRLLTRAVRDVATVLTLEERRAAKEKKRAEEAERRRVQAAKCKARDELRRWTHRKDATMEDIMRGRPIAGNTKCGIF